jgi:alginate O-acetyltransferase complex protein AlgI
LLFSTPLFLFIFLPFSLALYLAAPHALRNTVLLAECLAFYAWGEPLFIFVLLVSSVADYALGERVGRAGPGAGGWLALGVGMNLGLLITYKYLDFALAQLEPVLGPVLGPLPRVNLVLPLALSFVVFEKITYLVDIRRGVSRPAASFPDYMLFVMLFPKLLAGPIVKFHEVERSLRDRPVRLDDVSSGLQRFLWGLSRKVLLADPCGEVANAVFDLPAGQVGFRLAWLGVAAFTAQIYHDFAGYSDMAIGIARAFGFQLRENFNHPYGSGSFTEFWRRWHISLSTWIRDYLYFPLGGNRGEPWRTYANLCICFLLSGLWHGANWTYVAWGAWNGLFLVADRLFWTRLSTRIPRILAVGVTLALVMFGWALFRAPDIGYATALWRHLLSPGAKGGFVFFQPHLLPTVAVALASSLLAATGILRQAAAWMEQSEPGRLVISVAVAGLAIVAITKAVTVTFAPFLYFRF